MSIKTVARCGLFLFMFMGPSKRAVFSMTIKLFLSHLLCILCSLTNAGAHGGHSHGSSDSLNPREAAKIEALHTVIEAAANMEAHLFPAGLPVLDKGVLSQAELIDIGSYQLISGLARLYYQSYCTVCGDQPISEDIFIQKLLPSERRSGLIEKIIRGIRAKLWSSFTDLSLVSADLGSRLGRTVLILNVTWEVLETLISTFTPLKGAHLLCTPVQIAMTLAARSFQTQYRSFSLAPLFSEPRAWMFIKRALIASRVRSIIKSVQIKIGPIEIDPELLALANEEGHQRRLWFRGTQGNRERFVAWLDKKLEKNQAQQVNVSISRKDFLGSSKAWTLFLFTRRNHPHHLISRQDPLTDILKQGNLWVISLQEGFFNTLSREAMEASEYSTREIQQRYPLNPVFESLLEEHQEERGAVGETEGLRLLMADLQVIFDPRISKITRYRRAEWFEIYFVTWTYKLMLHEWNASNDQIQSFGQLWQEIKNRSSKGQFARLASHFSDFLRVAASSAQPESREDLLYQSGQFLLELKNFLQQVNESPGTPEGRERLNHTFKILEQRAPWVDRRVSKSTGWWPLKVAPRCEFL
jgi:hypothetical protein